MAARTGILPMRDSVLLSIGAAVGIAMQLALAPAIAIMGVMPNFVLVFVASAALLRPSDAVMAAGFFAGMAFDLAASGTPGVMAALLTLVAFCASRAAMRLGSDTLSVSLLICMVCSLLVEVCYALFYVADAGVPLGDAMLMRALPCALYDCGICLIILPALSAAFSARGSSMHAAAQSTTIRLR